MCDECKNTVLRIQFYSPIDYLNCLDYIKSLLKTGKYEIANQTCDLDKIKDASGHWIEDIITHEISCKNCGQVFICSCDTFHGLGGFRKLG